MAAADHNRKIRLCELSIVDEGDSVIIGDLESGLFIAVPPVGGLVIRALQEGASVEEAAVTAERFTGQPVDVATFADRLAGLGFLANQPDTDRLPHRTAAIQRRKWLAGPAPRKVRWLFGRTAWTVYATMFVFDLMILVIRPQLLPHPRAAYQLVQAGAGPSLVLLFPFAIALAAAHECGHWLAACAVGLKARFGIDHRMYFVVFETDLTQLWSLPRRRRYGPMLSGLAIDATVLALLLGTELGIIQHWWALPPLAAHLIAALAFTEAAAMTWQFLLFLRTDLYAVLAAATGCHDLWRVKTLSLRQALKILTPAQASELANAHPRDRAVAAWFRWLWLSGFLAASAWFTWFYVPLLTHLAAWIWAGLAASGGTSRFWFTIGCTVILAWRYGVPAILSARSVVRVLRQRQRPCADTETSRRNTC